MLKFPEWIFAELNNSRIIHKNWKLAENEDSQKMKISRAIKKCLISDDPKRGCTRGRHPPYFRINCSFMFHEIFCSGNLPFLEVFYQFSNSGNLHSASFYCTDFSFIWYPFILCTTIEILFNKSNFKFSIIFAVPFRRSQVPVTGGAPVVEKPWFRLPSQCRNDNFFPSSAHYSTYSSIDQFLIGHRFRVIFNDCWNERWA